MQLPDKYGRQIVLRVGIAYAVIGWFLAQVAEFAFDNFGAPDWALKTFVVLLLLGLPLALILAWSSRSGAGDAGSTSDGRGEPARYRIDDIEVDIRSRRLVRGGAPIMLPKLSFDLLVALIRAAPGVVTLDELNSAVWGEVVVSDETVTQRVKILRDALGDDGETQRYVETSRGVGYRLRPAAIAIDDAALAGRSAGRRNLQAIGGGMMGAVLIAAVLWLWRGDPGRHRKRRWPCCHSRR